MAIPHKSDEIPPNLARLIERGRRESEEARRLLGEDPQEALFKLIRENYDYESFRQYLDEIKTGGPGMWDNDDVDESAEE